MTFTVAVLGRPNVGKSTLFNRLVGAREALVDDTPGVTRDRREGAARLADMEFTVIDTAGLENATGDSLEARMRAQTEQALADADVALLLFDARAGVQPLDGHFADWLRRHDTPVLLVGNKCEGAAGDAGLAEAYVLGLGDPIAVSAEHGEGLAGLYQALRPFAEREGGNDETGAGADSDTENGADADSRPLQLAIVGRPNVGKSTLVNQLIGEDRVLTGPEAGITRDSIAVSWSFQGRQVQLVDTAGLRRKARVTGRLEGLSTEDTLRTIRFAQVVVLVVDATEGLEKQDLTIARHVIDEGRALVIALNKWDLIPDAKETDGRIGDRLKRSLPQVRGIPLVRLSALTGRGVEKLLPAVLDIFDVWNARVATAALNRWLESETERHPPPLAAGRRIRLRYMTQAKARPPTFIIFASRPEKLPDSYVRYLANGLRDTFGLPGVPLRLHLRKGRNPYAKA